LQERRGTLPFTQELAKPRIRWSLLSYCKLDTMAMVMIWKYWMK